MFVGIIKAADLGWPYHK